MSKIMIPKLAEAGEDFTEKTLIERIRSGKVLPIVSNVFYNELIFDKDEALVDAWASHIDYPLPDKRNLTHMIQYFSVTRKADTKGEADDRKIKETYLKFLKDALESIADPDLLDDLNTDTNRYKLTLTDCAERLCRPTFDVDQANANPLLLLADFKLPIYLTTSYHGLLECALKKAGAEPQIEICAWNERLRSIRSVFAGGSYDPSPEKPLVYHLYGLDANPDSLVLTEDDHMDFLVAISSERRTIPDRIRGALADSSLLLLGYRLRDWDFRVLFRGLIKPNANQPLRPKSVAIQLEENEIERRFLQNYLAQEADFKVFWRDTKTFIQDLWKGWKK